MLKMLVAHDTISIRFLQPIALLLARLYVAQVFFQSGLTKIQSWETTLLLFENEYQVPLLSPEWAAYLATAGELVLPVLLVIGLFTRFAALGLSILNVVAVIAYPFLWTVEGGAGFWQHVVWGCLLMALVLWGAGRLALDHVIARRLDDSYRD